MIDGYDILKTSPDALAIAADFFEEQGRYNEANALRTGAVLPERIISYGDGYGDGYAEGYGDGYAEGLGSGQNFGDGNGLGAEYVDGVGDGSGFGEGDGEGQGDGYGYGHGYGLKSAIKTFFEKELLRVDQLIAGNLYLFMTDGGFAWVGRFVRPLGLFGAYFTDNVNICRTGGTPWPRLAAGEGRPNARFQSWEVPGYEMPHVIVKNPLPWVGDLPPNR